MRWRWSGSIQLLSRSFVWACGVCRCSAGAGRMAVDVSAVRDCSENDTAPSVGRTLLHGFI